MGPIALPSTGAYTILAYDDNFQDTGGFNLNLQFTTGRCASGIACGQTIAGNITSKSTIIASKFAGIAGEAVQITGVTTSGTLCTRTNLYDSAGKLIGFTACNSSMGPVVLHSTGTYTLLSYDDNFQDTGTYNLNLQFTTGRCATWLPCSQTSAGSIAAKASMATYGFGATAGQSALITTATTTGTACTRANLYNPAGALLGVINCNSTSGPLALPTTGTYTILAYDDNFQDTGTFNLNWRFTNGCPACTLSPARLSFPSQLVGSASSQKTVTLTNTGPATMTITQMGLAGADPNDFRHSTTCGVSLAAGANCTIAESFRPTTKNTRTALVSIRDNAPASPHSVTLSGVGTFVTLAPVSLTFPTQVIHTPSGAQTVTLTNTGPTALAISGMAFSGTAAADFAQTNTCGTSVAAHASCTIRVTFTPSAIGPRTASLAISDDGGGSPQRLGISGTGQ
jgi:hypothetical protein